MIEINSGAAFEAPRPLAVTVSAACKFIGVGRTTMWALIKAGRIQTVRIGRRRVVLFASLEALLAQGSAS